MNEPLIEYLGEVEKYLSSEMKSVGIAQWLLVEARGWRETLKKRSSEAVERDAARYRWLRDTFAKAVGGGIEVNDAKLVYEEPEPGRAVRLYWYPDTPVGFNESTADSLDEAVDAARSSVGVED